MVGHEGRTGDGRGEETVFDFEGDQVVLGTDGQDRSIEREADRGEGGHVEVAGGVDSEKRLVGPGQ